MGPITVEIFDRGRWRAVGDFYTREAADTCYRIYTGQGYKVRFA